MEQTIRLSALADRIKETLEERFERETFWVSARIMNVKKYIANRRCYLTLEEYENGTKLAEIRAVFWSGAYEEIEKFENAVGQSFRDGTEIICLVRVRFHILYGLNLDVLQIDVAHTLGTLELERQQTLNRLLRENPDSIKRIDGVYRTANQGLPLPLLIQRIALITAPHSDGLRDFQQEIINNRHQYHFEITEFLTTIQGENAHNLILEQLQQIALSASSFDVVAIVRGGGSLADFRPFNQYELAQRVAHFPLPIFTGIGHDRNQSITDMMAREQKTPTKVASLFIDHNFEFENRLIDLRLRLENSISRQLDRARESLESARRLVKLASPKAILDRGFAIITLNNKIIIDPQEINNKDEIKTLLKDQIIHSTITKKTIDEKRFDL